MRIGITGHSNLTQESVPLVAAELREELPRLGRPLVGVSCLARGADQVFAHVVLEVGGELHVLLPAADYRARKVRAANRAEFEDLLGRAVDVRVLPFETSNRAAYAAANEEMLAGIDALVAVWDAAPADGKGGT
ncbi:MAG: hypothetical protein ACRDQ0_15095, partial [Pseudonocardia sp.]